MYGKGVFLPTFYPYSAWLLKKQALIHIERQEQTPVRWDGKLGRKGQHTFWPLGVEENGVFGDGRLSIPKGRNGEWGCYHLKMPPKTHTGTEPPICVDRWGL